LSGSLLLTRELASCQSQLGNLEEFIDVLTGQPGVDEEEHAGND